MPIIFFAFIFYLLLCDPPLLFPPIPWFEALLDFIALFWVIHSCAFLLKHPGLQLYDFWISISKARKEGWVKAQLNFRLLIQADYSSCRGGWAWHSASEIECQRTSGAQKCQSLILLTVRNINERRHVACIFPWVSSEYAWTALTIKHGTPPIRVYLRRLGREKNNYVGTFLKQFGR